MGELAIINRPMPVPSYSMADMETVANAIARSGMFGSKDPYAVLTLCMLARAEGQDPAVVFRDYHVISGKPAKKAEAMQRDFLAAGGRIEWHRYDDECAEATFSHPQGGTATVNWDKARVKQAQLGSNAMHGKYPRQMLKARVVSEGVRLIYPGATSGLYESAEVQDMVAQDTPAVATPQPQRARDFAALPADDGRQRAEQWVTDHLAAVSDAADLDALDAIRMAKRNANALARLQAEHDDLYQRVLCAYEDRAMALAGSTEGRDDRDMGDGFDGSADQ